MKKHMFSAHAHLIHSDYPLANRSDKDLAIWVRSKATYLRYGFGRIADHPITRIEQLLPRNVARSLSLETRPPHKKLAVDCHAMSISSLPHIAEFIETRLVVFREIPERPIDERSKIPAVDVLVGCLARRVMAARQNLRDMVNAKPLEVREHVERELR